jgi:hypothetical protein
VCHGRVCLLLWFHASGDDKQDDSYDDESDARKERGRGQPPIPQQWTGGASVEWTRRACSGGATDKTEHKQEDS